MKKTITATATAAAALTLAAPVQADPYGYIQALNNNGVTVWDANTALSWGYAICETLNIHNGEIVAEAFYQITDYSIPDRYTAGVWVVSAVENLCPWHDHRGRRQYLV